MFDEYVAGAVGRANVKPITLSTPQLDLMIEHVRSKAAGSLLIAGTAGDGKTYHCRALWTALGGGASQWSSAGTLKELRLADGRLAVFIKDLSEFNGDESDGPLARLEKSVINGDDSELVILAANHGQILDRLRDIGKRQGRVHPLRKPLQDFFLQYGDAPPRLAVFDLSRSTSRRSLEEVIAAVAGHTEWGNCEECPIRTNGKICPIYENRERLLGRDDGGQLAKRLGDLVDIARLNGWHLPVRDLLALSSNMILGHRDAKEGLMSCGDISRIQNTGTVEGGSLYSNVFGANLPKRRAADRPVFRAMAAFGIGAETTNSADGLLVYGKGDFKLSAAFERLIGNDAIYGATPAMLNAQDRYLEGDETARVDGGAAGFIDILQAQRSRLFFTLPESEVGYPFWAMTAFRFAGQYLEMRSALLERRVVAESARARLVRGLNRVMTGLLIDNVDRLFVASSGGFSQSRASVLCDTEVSSRRTNGVGMAMKLDTKNGRPMLDVALAQGVGNSVEFDLTPIRFEFLSRVAEGSLPGSFSNECLEDMLAFKAKLLRKAELIRSQSTTDVDEYGADDKTLTLNFIDVEQGGHGFSRPITVRVAQ